MLSRELDESADGIVDESWTYTYDEDGNMLTEEHDSDGNRTMDERITYTYDCWE